MADQEGDDVQSNHESQAAAISTSNGEQEINREVENISTKMEKAKEAYSYTTCTYSRLEDKPTRQELWGWYVYELCSYFVHTALIPVVFTLIIAQIVGQPSEPPQGWTTSAKGLTCRIKQMQLYERLTQDSITIGNSKVSPLEWTSICWGIGLIVATPALGFISVSLDRGQKQQLIAGTATAMGSLFCLPVGFFRVTWMFALYIAPIVIAIIVATASHTRHHGLMIRGYTGPVLERHQFSVRRGVSSWLSLYSTAAGGLGAAVVAAFVYYMLRIRDTFTGLWVVSIFSGLMWLAGVVHIFTLRPGASASPSEKRHAHALSILRYRHGLGSVIVVGLSSFTSMSIFSSGVLYLVGELCLESKFLLYLWLIYFIFPAVSMPLLQPLQLVLNTNAVKMHVLGLILSLVTSATGFQFRKDNWQTHHILIFGAVQSTSTGLLHAFGRVLLMDCSPAGKEGAFSVWYSWMKMLGTCLGFAVASAENNIGTSFGIAFCTAAVAIIISIYGNISDVGAAVAAGLISEETETHTANAFDNSISITNDHDNKEPVLVGEEAA